MPTYAYACTACDHRFEAQQAFTDEPLTECPECGDRIRKLFSSVGIVFKGSGFYRTDSRKNGRSGDSPASESSTKGSTKGSAEPSSNGSSNGTSSTASSSSAPSSSPSSSSGSNGSKAAAGSAA